MIGMRMPEGYEGDGTGEVRSAASCSLAAFMKVP